MSDIAPNSIPVPPANSLAFLVVDDNDLDFEKITRSFTRLKITNEVRRARDGIEALEILRERHTDQTERRPYIVLLDLNMPRMSGLELLAEMRDDPDLSKISVFVLTTSDHPKDIALAHEFNVAGYIVKPIRREQMFEAFNALNHFWMLCEYPK